MSNAVRGHISLFHEFFSIELTEGLVNIVISLIMSDEGPKSWSRWEILCSAVQSYELELELLYPKFLLLCFAVLI
jgi:hypothetical protein